MAAPTNYYVDPGGGSDVTGDGSIGNPWASVQHALDNITRDASNGDQINVKSGAADVLSGTLDTSLYGSPGSTRPLIIRGYTSAANDGGVGTLDGDGSHTIWKGPGYVRLVDMELRNSGANTIVELKSFERMFNCDVHGTSGNGVYANDASGIIIAGCHIYDVGGIGIFAKVAMVRGNYLTNGPTNNFTSAIRVTNLGADVVGNIISLSGSSDGVVVASHGCTVSHNSILSVGGTGSGIKLSLNWASTIDSNLVEGFSGAGGVGIDASSAAKGVCTHNSVYNCTTPIDEGDAIITDNETLGSSPFAKVGSDTYANRFAYFAPNDVGSVYGGAWLGDGNRDRGAVQHEASGGGGVTTVIVIEDD